MLSPPLRLAQGPAAPGGKGAAAVFGPPEGGPRLAAASAASSMGPRARRVWLRRVPLPLRPARRRAASGRGASRVGSARGRAVSATGVRVPARRRLREGSACPGLRWAVLRKGRPGSGLGARFARPPKRLGSANRGAGVSAGAGLSRPPKRLGAARFGLRSASEEAGVGSRSGGLSSTSEEVGAGSQLRCSWLRRRRSSSGAGGRRRSRWAAGSGRGSEELRLSPVFRWAGSSRGRGCALASC